MSISRTLRNKPCINYAVLNSGLDSTSPSIEKLLPLDLGSTLHAKDITSPDQQELEALEDEKAALSSV